MEGTVSVLPGYGVPISYSYMFPEIIHFKFTVVLIVEL